jgi:hypothetical protein
VPAGGEGDDRVARHQLMFPESGTSVLRDILGTLDGPHQGAEAARHDPYHPLRGIAEGGRNLRGVEHPDATARPRAHVEPAPTPLEGENQDGDGALHGREDPPDRLHRTAILGVDRVEDLPDAALIQIPRGLQDRLGEQIVGHRQLFRQDPPRI